MNTSLIRKSTRLVRDLSRPKPLPPIFGIKTCDPRLIWMVRTWLPLCVYPTLAAAVAAAPWCYLGYGKIATIFGLGVLLMSLRQARRDRAWFDLYTDCITRLAQRPLNNKTVRHFLIKEYARPLLFPCVWFLAWYLFTILHNLVIASLDRSAVEPSIVRLANTFFTAITAIAITLGAKELATRRRKDRALPIVKREIPEVAPISAFAPRYIRGTQLVTLADAFHRQSQILPLGDHGILWGAVCLPSDRCEHFFIFAVTRGGKTIVIRLLMQDMLCNVANPLLRSRRRARALLYDPKPELLPYAVAIQPHATYIITNPSDLRASAWDLAKDFATLTAAAQLALLLVPRHLQPHNDFYPKAVRAVLTEVFKAFILTTPGVWTLRDVFQVMKSEEDLRHLLDRHPETRGTLDQISRNEETRGNIDISIIVDLAPFKTLAARWHHCPRKFSLSDWMSGEAVLVVGRVDEESELFDAINLLLLNRASELLMSQPDKPDIRTYMFLDELATVKGFQKLQSLMTTGLSKFVSVILASQGVEGLKQQFGNEATEQFLGMCSNKAFLCLSQPTAEWAAKQIGKTDWLEIYQNWSSSSGTSWNQGSSQPSDNSSAYYANQGSTRQSGTGGSTSSSFGSSQQRNERYAQMPEELQHIPKPNKEMNVGLRGTFMSDSGSAYGIVPTEIPAESLFNHLLLPPDPNTADFIRRPSEHDLLPPWDDDDRKRLGFPPRGEQRTPLDTFLN